jgi:hypothetical protein
MMPRSSTTQLEHCHHKRKEKEIEIDVTNLERQKRLQRMISWSVLKRASMKNEEVEKKEDSDDSAKTLQYDGSGDEDSEDSAKTLQYDGSGCEELDVQPDSQLSPPAELPPIVTAAPSAGFVVGRCLDEDSEDSAKTLQYDGSEDDLLDVKLDNQLPPPQVQLPPQTQL